MPNSIPTWASTDFMFAASAPNSSLAVGKETFSFPSPSVFPDILAGVCRSNVTDNLSVWNTLGFSPGTLTAKSPLPSLSMRWSVFLAISLFYTGKNICVLSFICSSCMRILRSSLLQRLFGGRGGEESQYFATGIAFLSSIHECYPMLLGYLYQESIYIKVIK